MSILQPHFTTHWKERDIEICRVSVWPWKEYKWGKAQYALFCVSAAFTAVMMHTKQRFDLIHAHGDFLEALILGLVGRILGIPSVLTIHGGLNKRRLYTFLARICFRFVNRIIAVSPEIAADLSGRLKQDPSRIHCVSSGITWELYSPLDAKDRDEVRRNLGIPPKAIVVLNVGTLSETKGQRYLIQAANHLKSRSDLLFIFIGTIEDHSVSELMALTEARIRYIGPQPPREVVRYLQSADIFVLPSVDLRGKHEGTPTALMEAMAAGLPVVVTDSGGMPFLVENDVNGYIIPQKNVQILADRITWLADNPELRRSMGERNRLKMKDKDWSVISRAVEEVYRFSTDSYYRCQRKVDMSS